MATCLRIQLVIITRTQNQVVINKLKSRNTADIPIWVLWWNIKWLNWISAIDWKNLCTISVKMSFFCCDERWNHWIFANCESILCKRVSIVPNCCLSTDNHFCLRHCDISHIKSEFPFAFPTVCQNVVILFVLAFNDVLVRRSSVWDGWIWNIDWNGIFCFFCCSNCGCQNIICQSLILYRFNTFFTDFYYC